MNQTDTVSVRGWSIYPTEKFIVQTVARQQFEGNESMALRFIINDWAKRALVGKPDDSDDRGVLIDTRAAYDTK